MRILITGADGQLGRDLRDCPGRARCPPGACAARCSAPRGRGPGSSTRCWGPTSTPCRSTTGTPCCTPSPTFRPELVLHGGAFTAVDLCETEVDLAYAVNAIGTRHVAEAAALVGAHMVYVSTDYVFDGTSARPYREWDPPCPTSVYGVSKLAGERECRPGSTIVRTSWLCGAHGDNMVKTALRLAEGDGRAALRRRPAGVAHLHRRPGAGDRHPGPRPPAGHLPRDQQRRDDLVGLRAGRAGRGRRRPRAGEADRHGRSRPAATRRPGRPTRCSTTWRCA